MMRLAILLVSLVLSIGAKAYDVTLILTCRGYPNDIETLRHGIAMTHTLRRTPSYDEYMEHLEYIDSLSGIQASMGTVLDRLGRFPPSVQTRVAESMKDIGERMKTQEDALHQARDDAARLERWLEVSSTFLEAHVTVDRLLCKDIREAQQ